MDETLVKVYKLHAIRIIRPVRAFEPANTMAMKDMELVDVPGSLTAPHAGRERGASFVGKTTFIGTISETEVVSTDAHATEQIGKEMTTVAMDFGTLTIDGIEIYLFGTPGQDRFEYMWQVLSEGALGLLLLLAGDRPADFMRARIIIDTITSRMPHPFVIGVTRQDMSKVWAPEDIADFFHVDPRLVVGLDARDPASCIQALVHLMEIITDQNSSANSTPALAAPDSEPASPSTTY